MATGAGQEGKTDQRGWEWSARIARCHAKFGHYVDLFRLATAASDAVFARVFVCLYSNTFAELNGRDFLPRLALMLRLPPLLEIEGCVNWVCFRRLARSDGST